MNRFLFRFGYESPAEWEGNLRDGTDFESSAAVLISAIDSSEADDLGRGYADRFVAGLFYEAGAVGFPGWLEAGYAHWVERVPEPLDVEMADFPRIRSPNPLSLETERLRLRELRTSDLDAVHAYASDPVAVRFMPWGPNTEAATVDFLRRAVDQTVADPRLGHELAVTLRETSELIGAIGLHRLSESHSEAMLGYCLARPVWRRGYAIESARAMLRLGFGDLGLESVWAGCDAENTASIRVLEKLGMSLEAYGQEDGEERGERGSLMYRIRASEMRGSL